MPLFFVIIIDIIITVKIQSYETNQMMLVSFCQWTFPYAILPLKFSIPCGVCYLPNTLKKKAKPPEIMIFNGLCNTWSFRFVFIYLMRYQLFSIELMLRLPCTLCLYFSLLSLILSLLLRFKVLKQIKWYWCLSFNEVSLMQFYPLNLAFHVAFFIYQMLSKGKQNHRKW